MAKNKPWENSHSGRKQPTRTRRRVLIVCEDEKSSRFYFQSFPIDPNRAEVKAVGTGMNTDTLVQEAKRILDRGSKDGTPYSEVWCVLDRDSFPAERYQRAFEIAAQNRINIAWTNEAFEFWYLLHFNYHDTGIGRSEYASKLKPYVGGYSKADDQMYAKVLKNQETALKNARRLQKFWNEIGEKFPERKNPSTNVHRLVEFLNELCDLDPT